MGQLQLMKFNKVMQSFLHRIYIGIQSCQGLRQVRQVRQVILLACMHMAKTQADLLRIQLYVFSQARSSSAALYAQYAALPRCARNQAITARAGIAERLALASIFKLAGKTFQGHAMAKQR